MAPFKKITTLTTILITTLFLSAQTIPLQDACHNKEENECEISPFCAWTPAKPPKKGICEVDLRFNSPDNILKFQKEHDLELTGKLDKETLKKIDELKNLKIK